MARQLGRLGGACWNLDDGRRLAQIGRDEWKYSEGDRCLTLQVEMLTGKPNLMIYAQTINRWAPPYETDRVSPEKRREIAETICQFLTSIGESPVVRY